MPKYRILTRQMADGTVTYEAQVRVCFIWCGMYTGDGYSHDRLVRKFKSEAEADIEAHRNQYLRNKQVRVSKELY
jgi:hypothetical protein